MANLNYAVIKKPLSDDILNPNVDFTSPEFGTVKAAIVFACNAYVGDTGPDDVEFDICFWDGTNTRMLGVYTNDVVSVTDTSRVWSDDTAIWFIQAGDATNSKFTISSVTDGVRLTITTGTPNVRRWATVILFNGSDFTADVGNLTLGANQNDTASVTTLSQQPDVVLIANPGMSTKNTVSPHAHFCLGCATSASTQRVVSGASTDNIGTSDSNTWFSDTRISGQAFSGGTDYTVECTAFASNGFTLTTRDAGSGSDVVIWMAINLGGGSAWLGTLTTPTSTGEDAETGPGFRPKCLLVAGSNATTVGQANTWGLSLGASDGRIESACSSVDEDNRGVADSDSQITDGMIDIRDATGSNKILANLASLDSSGYTLDYSKVSTARKGWVLAFEQGDDSTNKRPLYRQVATPLDPATVRLKNPRYQLAHGLVGGWSSRIAPTAHDLINNNHGVLTSGTVLGRFGWEFDATNDSIDMGDAKRLDFTGGAPFSLACWCKRDSATRYNNMITKLKDAGSSAIAGYMFTHAYVSSNSYVEFWLMKSVAATTYIQVRTTSAYNATDEWEHWAVSYDGSQAASGVSIYRNGDSVSLTTQQDNFSTSAANAGKFLLGNRDDVNTQVLDGYLDDCLVWGRCLKAEEIALLGRLPRGEWARQQPLWVGSGEVTAAGDALPMAMQLYRRLRS